jgi:hypothetical protein
MTCVELQQSLVETERGRSREQMTHLKTCAACTELVRELDLIIAAAGDLQDADDPSPRVWNSIEIALRQEGLIRSQGRKTSHLPSFGTRWGWASWLVPAAAALLIMIGIYQRRQSSAFIPEQQAATVAPVASPAGLNDADLLEEVAANSPSMRDEYEENLRKVNEYIRDEESIVKDTPNDEDARRALMDAYQQKSLLFEMAMEHLQP